MSDESSIDHTPATETNPIAKPKLPRKWLLISSLLVTLLCGVVYILLSINTGVSMVVNMMTPYREANIQAILAMGDIANRPYERIVSVLEVYGRVYARTNNDKAVLDSLSRVDGVAGVVLSLPNTAQLSRGLSMHPRDSLRSWFQSYEQKSKLDWITRRATFHQFIENGKPHYGISIAFDKNGERIKHDSTRSKPEPVAFSITVTILPDWIRNTLQKTMERALVREQFLSFWNLEGKTGTRGLGFVATADTTDTLWWHGAHPPRGKLKWYQAVGDWNWPGNPWYFARTYCYMQGFQAGMKRTRLVTGTLSLLGILSIAGSIYLYRSRRS
ncbi:MAG: hypothetical protein OEM52_11435 [bacterium]|nr:hypothetical protein [bacterium]